jgi:NAD(P)-dependent dehydrogenase (short-subunit alcohol dehydrogenase family)
MTISTTIIERPTGLVGKKLAGRVALVTGGARGIGAAIARSLASEEATVAAGYSEDQENAELFLKEFECEYEGAGRASIHQGNVSKPEDCRRVVQRFSTNMAGSTSWSTMPVSPWTRWP